MTKYVLKCIDVEGDDLSATVTYEFEAENMSNVTYHLAQFLRSAGFTWVDTVEVTSEYGDEKNEFSTPEDEVHAIEE